MYRFLILSCQHCFIRGLEMRGEKVYEVCKHPECCIDRDRQRPLEDREAAPKWCPLRDGETVISLAVGA